MAYQLVRIKIEVAHPRAPTPPVARPLTTVQAFMYDCRLRGTQVWYGINKWAVVAQSRCGKELPKIDQWMIYQIHPHRLLATRKGMGMFQ